MDGALTDASAIYTLVESPVVININLTIAITLPPEPFLNLAKEDGTIDIISTTSQHSAPLLFVKYWGCDLGCITIVLRFLTVSAFLPKDLFTYHQYLQFLNETTRYIYQNRRSQASN